MSYDIDININVPMKELLSDKILSGKITMPKYGVMVLKKTIV